MSDSEPARTAARRTRSAGPAAFLLVGAALVGVAVVQSLASSTFSTESPVDDDDQDYVRGEAGGAVPVGLTVFDDEVPAVANLDPDLLGALRRAAADAADDGVEFVVNGGWRSPAYQARLRREAVTKYGSEEEAARWVATPATSPHVLGHAVDIGPSDARAWLAKHGAEYGLCQIYRNEPWHYELRPESINDGCPPMYADPSHDPRMQQ